MSLSLISIKRPVLAIVMSVVILLFGAISYTLLGVREYPSIDPPIITVNVTYTGANADIIETQITEPLEESINGIAGIRSLTSVSRDGRSQITVEFDVDQDLEAAANDVRDRVSKAQSLLPPDVNPPTVVKADADANPIIMFNLITQSRSLLEVSAFSTNVVKERLQTIPGVSEVSIWGEKKYSMRLWLEPSKMSAFGIVPSDIRSALAVENIELPSGKIEGTQTELTIRTLGRIFTEKDFNNMIIKEVNGYLVRLSDIGYASLGPEVENMIMKRDGRAAIGIALLPQPGSNHIKIANEFYSRIEQIKRDMPADLEIAMGYDVTRFIRRSISEVGETIVIAFLLVIAIIFLFLRDWRTTVIPIIAIPISLVGVFFIMYLMNFTINVLTLLGIVLAIGIVVDDAIVVLENIYSKVEEGQSPLEAGKSGSSEIFFAIVSTTLTLAAVFLPILFMEGIAGRLFREFGVVIAGSVVISAFVALSLTPMLSTKILKGNAGHNKFYTMTEPIFETLNNLYRRSLEWFMDRRWLSFVVMAVCVAGIYFFYGGLKSELAPLEDRSFIRVQSTAPEGTSFAAMNDYMDNMYKLCFDSVPEASAMMYGAAIGGGGGAVNSGFIRLMLKDREERQRSQQEIAEMLSTAVKKNSDAITFIAQEQTIGTSKAGQPVQFVVQAPNFDALKDLVPKFLSEARKDPTFRLVDVNLKFNKPELAVNINRAKAREMGVSVQDIAQALQLGFSGQRYGFFIKDGKQYQVIGQLLRDNRSKPNDVSNLYVRNKTGVPLQLDNFITISEQSSPPQLYRYNRYSAATFQASLAPGKSIGDGIAAMDKVYDQVADKSFLRALAGPSKDYAESSSNLMFTFMFAIVLIFLILAGQFESFRDPLTIMLTVPLAIAGAVASLYIFNQTMNIYSQIGMIMLIGLVTKNGILIVEFANQRRRAGGEKLESVVSAATQRFRPILMTSLSTALGALPIALALGAGSESRVSMGIVVVFGIMFSTVLTLYVIPAMYMYLSSKRVKIID